MPSDAITVERLSKAFGATQALDGVSFTVAPGEVRALIGQNGAGKSTLVKIFGGYHAPDAGEISLWGNKLRLPISNPASHGVAIVHQDLGLVDELSVWENIGVGTSFDGKLLAPLSKRAARSKVRKLIARFDQPFGPDDKVGSLEPAQRSIVAILRAIGEMDAHDRAETLLILDEPTSRLFGEDVERLLDFIRLIAGAGSSVILVEHHLQHVLDAAHSVTVLRSGQVVGTYPVGEVSIPELVHLMLGYEAGHVTASAPSPGRSDAAPALSVNGLSGNVVTELSFSAGLGEVVGVTGLAGMGQEEIPYLLAGATKRASGEVMVEGKAVGPSLRDALRNKMVLVPNRAEGIWLEATATENVTLPVLNEVGSALRMVRSRQEGRTAALLEEFDVTPRDPTLPMSAFSGGNQQKVLLAKWLQTKPRVLLLDSPTRGVDAGGRIAVLQLIRNSASAGCAVVIASEDAEELTEVCDQILVLRDGELIATLREAELSVPNILAVRERKASRV